MILILFLLFIVVAVGTMTLGRLIRKYFWQAIPSEIFGNSIHINGERYYYTLKGHKGPVVIIQPGWGSLYLEWSGIIEMLSNYARVFAYDRPGYGWSTPSRKGRTPSQISLELKVLLSTLKLKGPYILVGQDYGGLLVHQFAHMFPEEVSNILLINPVSPAFFKIQKLLPGAILKKTLPRMLKNSGFLKIFAVFGLSKQVRQYFPALQCPNIPPYRYKIMKKHYQSISFYNTLQKEYTELLNPLNFNKRPESTSYEVTRLTPLPYAEMNDLLVSHHLQEANKLLLQSVSEELIKEYYGHYPALTRKRILNDTRCLPLQNMDLLIDEILAMIYISSEEPLLAET